MDTSLRRPRWSRRRVASVALAAAVVAGTALAGWRALGLPGETAGVAGPLLVERPAVGVQFHGTWEIYRDEELALVVDRLATAGVRWVRIDIGWRSIEPIERGTLDPWYLDRSDRAVTVAAERGLRVLVTLWTTPRWANGGRDGIVPPDDPDDYASVARRLAERWRGKVQAWEVWNEPNHEDFFEGGPDDYAAMLRAAYPAFKDGDPDAVVVGGAVSYNDTGWLEDMYDAGVDGSFDALSTHPYPAPSDMPPEDGDEDEIETFGHLKAVRALMDERGDADKPIWATEVGWSSHPDEPGAEAWERGVTPEEQADYLVRAVHLLAEEHPSVPVVFWYRERDLDTDDAHYDGFGLLTEDLHPKPAYHALRRLLVGR